MGSAEGEAAPHDLLQPLPGLRQLEGGAEASSWGAVMDDGGAGPTPFSSAPVHTAPSETGMRGGARDAGRGWRGERRVDGKCLPIRSPPPSPGPSRGLQVTRRSGRPLSRPRPSPQTANAHTWSAPHPPATSSPRHPRFGHGRGPGGEGDLVWDPLPPESPVCRSRLVPPAGPLSAPAPRSPAPRQKAG